MNERSQVDEQYHPWTTYIASREEARRVGDRRVGTDHLVLGLLHDPEIADVLSVSLGQAREAFAKLDQESLARLGLPTDIDPPPRPTRALPPRPTLRAVLTDRLPLTPSAKLALQEAGKPMRHGKRIRPQDVLLTLLERRPPDPAGVLLAEIGVDVDVVRNRIAPPSQEA